MSSKSTSVGRLPHWKSDQDRVEIVLFSCGHGDTILIRIPGPRWGLIDCNLPDKTTFSRFVNFLDSNNIMRFNFVVLTHPDIDHYAGLADVLTHLRSKGGGVDHFYDSGLNHVEVIQSIEAIGRPADEAKEFFRLISAINASGTAMHRVDDSRKSIAFSGTSIQFTPIAPAEATLLSASRRAFRSHSPSVKTNDISIVLIMTHKNSSGEHHFLFSGDAGSVILKKAIGIWCGSNQSEQKDAVFRESEIIKLPLMA